MWTDRTKVLIGEGGIEKLQKTHIVVVGVGGVGGYVCHLLVRAGVGKITIVDFDKVDETNINRQVVANTKTIGKNKVDVMRTKLLEINPNLEVNALNCKVCAENLQGILPNDEKIDFVVDAIDSVKDKIDLICYCKQHGLKIISAMGAGNRIKTPNFEVIDIYKTHSDGLAKVMRKKLRERGVESLMVVTSSQSPIKHEEKVIGSISYQPAMCGCVLAGFVVSNVLNDEC